MGKRIELDVTYRPSKADALIARLKSETKNQKVPVHKGSSVVVIRPKYEYGTPEYLAQKRSIKAEQMRRYRAKKAGK